MKKVVSIIILAFVIIALGRTSQEVRDRAFIQSIVVQSDENNIYTSIKLYGYNFLYKGIGDNIETSLKSAETRQGKVFFTGHTEMIVFYNNSFSVDILKEILENENVSPNCAVILSYSNIEDTELAFSILETYDRLDQVSIKTASDIIKELKEKKSVDVPLLKEDLTYINQTISS